MSNSYTRFGKQQNSTFYQKWTEIAVLFFLYNIYQITENSACILKLQLIYQILGLFEKGDECWSCFLFQISCPNKVLACIFFGKLNEPKTLLEIRWNYQLHLNPELGKGNKFSVSRLEGKAYSYVCPINIKKIIDIKKKATLEKNIWHFMKNIAMATRSKIPFLTYLFNYLFQCIVININLLG